MKYLIALILISLLSAHVYAGKVATPEELEQIYQQTKRRPTLDEIFGPAQPKPQDDKLAHMQADIDKLRAQVNSLTLEVGSLHDELYLWGSR